MKCDEFEQRLNLVLDERRRPEWDNELRQHTEGCAACRELSAAYALLLDGFYALTTPEAPADLSVRVLDEWQARPATRRLAVISAVLTTAAAVAIAAYLPWRSAATRPQVAKVSPPAVSAPVPPASVAQVAEAPATEPTEPTEQPPFDWQELDELPLVGPMLVSMSDNDDKTDPYAALAKGTGQSLASVVLYMPGVGPKGFVAPSASARGILPAAFNEEFRPVTESMTETLNLLLRAVPLSTAPMAPRKAS